MSGPTSTRPDPQREDFELDNPELDELEPLPAPSAWKGWPLCIALMVATWLSVLRAGQTRIGAPHLLDGLDFALPLMAILTAHEFGHYFAARWHKVDLSPPYFLPVPFSTLLGTMGAVIVFRGRIRTRKALLDIGAAGPIAGFLVAVPVLWYGLSTSVVGPAPRRGRFIEGTGILADLGLPRTVGGYLAEGRSLLYELMLRLTHGPMPEGYDITLNGPALAGWAGLLVTMINLIPFGQLDGGHIAYALDGERQDRRSKLVLFLLPFIALASSGYYVVRGLLAGHGDFAVYGNALAGLPWLVWFALLSLLAYGSGIAHPPTGRLSSSDPYYDGHSPEDEEDAPLGPGRRAIAYLTLVLFVLLFMPAWMRQQ